MYLAQCQERLSDLGERSAVGNRLSLREGRYQSRNRRGDLLLRGPDCVQLAREVTRMQRVLTSFIQQLKAGR